MQTKRVKYVNKFGKSELNTLYMVDMAVNMFMY